MSLFQKKTDPFSEELKRLEEESRRVEEKMRRLEASIGQPSTPPPDPSRDDDHFKGATFRDEDQYQKPPSTTKRALKIQKRRTRNRVIALGAVLLLLLLILFRVLG